MNAQERILYLCGEEFLESNGIAKKISQQVDTLKRLGFSVDIVHRKDRTIYFNNEKVHSVNLGFINRFLYFFYVNFYLRKFKKTYHIFYLRNPDWFLPIGLSWFLKSWKSKTKFILEIPTYPYDSECISWKSKVALFLHRMHRSKLKNYVDLVAYMGEETKLIWGIKSVKIENAIDLNKVTPVGAQPKVTDKIVFVGVARLSYWHGYDRLITALDHYKKRGSGVRIQFLIVGSGEKEISRLKSLAINFGLDEEEVTFRGPLFGKELDELFDHSHIGVDSLGRHRSGIKVNSSLKSKEYIARGIPLIKSHNDNSLDGLPFVFDVSADENIIDLVEVVNWYKSLAINSGEIRQYARENFSWDTQMENVLKALK